MQTFGKFTSLFTASEGDVPAYLKLLGAHDDASSAIDLIKTAIEDSGDDVGKEIGDLFQRQNWRPQLVAASAMLAGKLYRELPLLWAALDQPCWTSPQLAAVASRLDSSFLQQARIRLEAECVMNMEEALTMTPVQRHSALGPTSFDGHSAKVIVTYVTLCSEEKDAETWLPQLVTQPHIQRALELNIDKAGDIALRWRNNMDKLLADR